MPDLIAISSVPSRPTPIDLTRRGADTMSVVREYNGRVVVTPSDASRYLARTDRFDFKLWRIRRELERDYSVMGR